ncbi:helicase-related protein [Lujinxingia vulgaris]|uniref:helicase-related protein n=1 Tax=Lujinxingia vulgaris TaxID=2600176 RepID=UPI001E502CC5
MLTQFQKELWSRFTIPLVRLDSTGLQRIRRKIPTNQNPFHYFDRAIISVDTLKQNNEFRHYLEQAHWDVIVIDEAHNVAVRGHDRSQRARLAQLLSRRSDALIMLSATPHDGRAQSFASLMNMLDPTAIADEENYTPEDIEGLFIRRFKGDVADQLGDKIPSRELHRLNAQASLVEEQVFDAFAELDFSALDSPNAKSTGGRMLFKTSLEKGLLSSPAAAMETIDNRIKTIESRETADRYKDDVAQLQHLRRVLERVAPEDFSKFQLLVDTLTDDDSPFKFSGHFKDDRLVIFTERIATMRWLASHLPAALGLDEKKVACLYGGMSDLDQQQVVEDFGRESSDIRLLIASDVASEGINLHYYCHRMVHFDIPWSLMVFQQRNGRVDRYGQTRTPHIAYLSTLAQNERIYSDTRILEILVEKDDQASRNIGDPSALMGTYDVEEQELQTAEAIEGGASPDAFLAAFETDNPLEALLKLSAASQQDQKRGEGPATDHLPALFANDYDYLREALYFLKSRYGFEVSFDDDAQRIDLRLNKTLRRAFEKLPDEVIPDDDRLLLSARTEAMDEAIAHSRTEESAWPALHYLWRLHPLLEWANDRVAYAFGRHTAPLITVDRGLEPGESLMLISTLIPNQKGQPLVQRWYGVLFRDTTLTSVLSFDEVRERLELGSRPIPNQLPELNPERLQALLPQAVERARAEMLKERERFEDAINPRLQAHLDRLETLKERQLTFAFESAGVTDPAAAATHDEVSRKKREIDALFDEYIEWIEASMTTDKIPFVQVIAAFRSDA